MTAVLITSFSGHVGRTMVCAGLGKHWVDSGRKVGYFCPVFFEAEKNSAQNKSIGLVRQLLSLNETVEVLSPLISSDPLAIQAAYSVVSQGKEMMFIESNNTQAEILSSITGAKIIVVHDYALDLGKVLPEYAKLSGKLAGVIINKVPPKTIPVIAKKYEEILVKAGLKLLGVIPENRVLDAFSVGDLAEAIDGKILNNPEKATDLIENYMLGSSTFDRGVAYYQRKNNKAVLVWGERPGYRKAALAGLPQLAVQTSTRCVVICDGALPLPAIIQKAEEKGVPLISAPGKLSDVITKLERAVGVKVFAQEQKIPLLLDILSNALNQSLFAGDFSLG